DLDTRSGVKHTTVWEGYKVHLTETCRPAGDGSAAPNLITNVATTDATVCDIDMTEPIHGQLAARRLAPDRHYVDSGYTSPDQILAAHRRGITLVGPLLDD